MVSQMLKKIEFLKGFFWDFNLEYGKEQNLGVGVGWGYGVWGIMTEEGGGGGGDFGVFRKKSLFYVSESVLFFLIGMFWERKG